MGCPVQDEEDHTVSQSQPCVARAPISRADIGAEEPAAGTVRHGDWTIFYDPPPIPTRSMDWGFYHRDFDASWEGEEDGYVSNGLGGRGASVEDCLSQIAEMEADRAA